MSFETGNWYLRQGLAEVGPVDPAAVLTQLESGTLLGDVLVRHESEADWRNLRDHPAFNQTERAETPDWVARSGRLTPDQFAGVPGWPQHNLHEYEDGFVLSLRAPISDGGCTASLCVYRDGHATIRSGYDTSEAERAFGGSVNAIAMTLAATASVTLQVADRVLLGSFSGSPWAHRAICTVASLENANRGYYQWVAVTAARNHFVKLLISVSGQDTNTEMTSIYSLFECVARILCPPNRFFAADAPQGPLH